MKAGIESEVIGTRFFQRYKKIDADLINKNKYDSMKIQKVVIIVGEEEMIKYGYNCRQKERTKASGRS